MWDMTLQTLKTWSEIAAGFTPGLLVIFHWFNTRRNHRIEQTARATLAEIRDNKFLVVKDNGDLSLQELVDRIRWEQGLRERDDDPGQLGQPHQPGKNRHWGRKPRP